MCKWCTEHGAGKKWYLNAKNYSNELADSMDLKHYLEEQWMNFYSVNFYSVNFYSVNLLVL